MLALRLLALVLCSAVVTAAEPIVVDGIGNLLTVLGQPADRANRARAYTARYGEAYRDDDGQNRRWAGDLVAAEPAWAKLRATPQGEGGRHLVAAIVPRRASGLGLAATYRVDCWLAADGRAQVRLATAGSDPVQVTGLLVARDEEGRDRARVPLEEAWFGQRAPAPVGAVDRFSRPRAEVASAAAWELSVAPVVVDRVGRTPVAGARLAISP